MKKWLEDMDTKWLREQIAKLTMIGAVFIAPMVLAGALCHVLGV